MKVGYPCLNSSVGCRANQRFTLAHYSEANLIEKVTNNLSCLDTILRFNLEHQLLFFRISSDIVPFASHPICQFDWQTHFANQWQSMGAFINQQQMRISMHPDQFVLLNALDTSIVEKSIADLEYHCAVLDSLDLDTTAKIQIHVGGVYGDKPKAIERFIRTYQQLPPTICRRLAIENDDRLFSLQDCLHIHKSVGIPLIFDTFHHQLLNNGETIAEALQLAHQTWTKSDGLLLIDYSSQAVGERTGKHSATIDEDDFAGLIAQTQALDFDFDIMLEIKDKELSAQKAISIVKQQRKDG